MKTYDWNLKDGRKVTLEAEYSESVEQRILDADGWKIEAGEEIRTRAMLTVYIDGQKFDSCWDENFWRIIDTGKPGIKKIWGIKGIGFTDERAAEIEQFFASVIEDGRSPKAQAMREEKKAQEKADLIRSYEKILTKASGQMLYTKDEAAIARQNWIDLNNEGGEGYVPHFWTYDEVEDIKKKLEELRA